MGITGPADMGEKPVLFAGQKKVLKQCRNTCRATGAERLLGVAQRRQIDVANQIGRAVFRLGGVKASCPIGRAPTQHAGGASVIAHTKYCAVRSGVGHGRNQQTLHGIA